MNKHNFFSFRFRREMLTHLKVQKSQMPYKLLSYTLVFQILLLALSSTKQDGKDDVAQAQLIKVNPPPSSADYEVRIDFCSFI